MLALRFQQYSSLKNWFIFQESLNNSVFKLFEIKNFLT